jgi:hypothetical protein
MKKHPFSPYFHSKSALTGCLDVGIAVFKIQVLKVKLGCFDLPLGLAAQGVAVAGWQGDGSTQNDEAVRMVPVRNDGDQNYGRDGVVKVISRRKLTEN